MRQAKSLAIRALAPIAAFILSVVCALAGPASPGPWAPASGK